jgi:hypothetical protein
MPDFGFDPWRILSESRANQEQSSNDMRTLSDLFTQRQQRQNAAVDNQIKQASLADMLYKQQAQRNLASVAGGQFYDPVASATAQTGDVDSAMKLQQMIEGAVRQRLGTIKSPDEYAKYYAGMSQGARDHLGLTEQYDPEQIQRVAAGGLPVDKQATYLDEQRRRGQLRDPNSPAYKTQAAFLRGLGIPVQDGMDLNDIGDKQEATAERLAQAQLLFGARPVIGVNQVTGAYYNKTGKGMGGATVPATGGTTGGGATTPGAPDPVPGSKAYKALDGALKEVVDQMDPYKGKAGAFGKDGLVVQAADKLRKLTDNGNNLNLIPSQMTELSTAVANLISGGSSAAQSQIEHLTPKTLVGDANGIAQWVTGNPTGADQQKFVKLMMETAQREEGGALDRIRNVQLNRATRFQASDSAYPRQIRAALGRYLSGLTPDEVGAAISGKYKPAAHTSSEISAAKKWLADPTNANDPDRASVEKIVSGYGG